MDDRTGTALEDMGMANVQQIRRELQELGTPFVGEVTDGQMGRTIHYTSGTGSICILDMDRTEGMI